MKFSLLLLGLIGLFGAGCSYGLRNYRYDNVMVREQQGQLLDQHLPDSRKRDRLMAIVGPRVGFLVCGDLSKGFDPVTEPYGNGRAAALTSDGYYLTASHVIDNKHLFLVETLMRQAPVSGPISEEEFARLVKVNVFPGRVVWRRADLDLAILKFPRKGRYYFKKLDDEVAEGDLIYTADDSGRGTFVLEEGLDSLVGNGSFETAGKVTSVRKSMFASEGRVIRSSLLARGGMSGAPIVTENGDLCGIIVRLEGNPIEYRTVASMYSPERIREIIAEDRKKEAGR